MKSRVGYAADNSWSTETTNDLRRNDPFGSNIGSKRCGGNWYAADKKILADLLVSPDLGAVLSILFVVVVFAGIGWLNHLAAAELQRQLDALPITGEHEA